MFRLVKSASVYHVTLVPLVVRSVKAGGRCDGEKAASYLLSCILSTDCCNAINKLWRGKCCAAEAVQTASIARVV
jgi:hypothetical protein